MNEVMMLLRQLVENFEVIRAYILSIKKSKLDNLKEAWVDGNEVAKALNVSNRTLQTFRDNGTLPYSRVRGKFYYKVSDIETLLESNYSPSKTVSNGTK
ncbi:MAG: helix-turn-helix domain-containing protein [Chitinophagaceae bacterium]|nr:helix-turn-helix domain-containing protein [Chitinophagaceae bacterium]